LTFRGAERCCCCDTYVPPYDDAYFEPRFADESPPYKISWNCYACNMALGDGTWEEYCDLTAQTAQQSKELTSLLEDMDSATSENTGQRRSLSNSSAPLVQEVSAAADDWRSLLQRVFNESRQVSRTVKSQSHQTFCDGLSWHDLAPKSENASRPLIFEILDKKGVSGRSSSSSMGNWRSKFFRETLQRKQVAGNLDTGVAPSEPHTVIHAAIDQALLLKGELDARADTLARRSSWLHGKLVPVRLQR
jgi:hypothetical protein